MRKIRVGITMGDPAGIGPAITRKALFLLKGAADFTVIADARVLEKTRCGQSMASVIKLIDLANVEPKGFTPGAIKAEYGKASIQYIDKGLQLIKNNAIDCLVTCPISKEAVNKAGFAFPGHTEYLAQKSSSRNVTMMLLNKFLKFSLLTTHLSLRLVPEAITREKVIDTVCLTDESLKKLFRIKKPRIVACGLNPHASDNGLFGSEENTVVRPALEVLRSRKKINIAGPISSDVAILMARRKEFDAVLAMYHDQALIPLKLTGADSGVNLTLGLPFVRTSPLHGTAFDIAITPRLADAGSLIAAIKTAVQCCRNQKKP